MLYFYCFIFKIQSHSFSSAYVSATVPPSHLCKQFLITDVTWLFKLKKYCIRWLKERGRRRKKATTTLCFVLKDHSQTLVRGFRCSKGGVDPPKDGLEKKIKIPGKIEFIWFAVGLTHKFNVKKGVLKFLRSEKGTHKFLQSFLCLNQPPPPTHTHKCLPIWPLKFQFICGRG